MSTHVPLDSLKLDPSIAHKAACIIQKTYRGYRTRRELDALNLDASRRWVAAVREARYHSLRREVSEESWSSSEYHSQEFSEESSQESSQKASLEYPSQELLSPESIQEPLSPESTQESSYLPTHIPQEGAQNHNDGPLAQTSALTKWHRAAAIARRANHASSLSDSGDSLTPPLDATSPRARRRRRRAQHDMRQRQEAVMMKLDYFLEMVDLKHRHGSNLRQYHAVWKDDVNTRQNFFYWLDHGDGRDVDLPQVSRARLEREQVRYLSRDERQNYLVRVDAEGRLCWAKNGERINTTTEYKDSVRGIVPVGDPTPAFGEETLSILNTYDSSTRYPDPLDNPHGVSKVTHLSAPSILNRLLRRTVRKNTWIFVADTYFRLYIGLKQPGAFQHSSFLQGARISAAGLIRVSDGRLRSLSPLSGHYRPPASSFRAFVASLRAAGVDTSRVSISKAYVVLLGLEAWVKTRRRGRRVRKSVVPSKGGLKTALY